MSDKYLRTNPFIKQVCDHLGMPDDHVSGVSIDARPHDVLRVHVEFLVEGDAIEIFNPPNFDKPEGGES